MRRVRRVRRVRRRRDGRPAARGAPRAGFTLVEVIIAIVLLGGVLLSFAEFTRRFVRAGSAASIRSTASDVAVDRIEVAKSLTSYAGIDSLVRTETITPQVGGPTFTRRTAVRRTAGLQGDYRTVTVTVTHPTLPAPVKKTTIIAAF